MVDQSVELIKPQAALRLDCIEHIASRFSPKGQFIEKPSGNSLLYLKTGKRVNKSMLYRHDIMDVSLSDFSSRSMMSIEVPKSSAMFANTDKQFTLNLISWGRDKADCEAAKGQLVSFGMDITSKEFRPVGLKYSGELLSLNSGNGLSVYDKKIGYLLEIDAGSYQVKRKAKLSGFGFPVYVFPGKRKFLFLNTTPIIGQYSNIGFMVEKNL